MASSQTFLYAYRINYDANMKTFSIAAAKGSGGTNGSQYNSVTLSDGTSSGSTQAGESFDILGDIPSDKVNNSSNNGTSDYIGVGKINGVEGVVVYDANAQGGGGHLFLTGTQFAVGTTGGAVTQTTWVLGGTGTPASPVITGVSDNQMPATGNVSNGGSTNDTTPTIGGTAAAGSTVTVYGNGSLLGTTVAGSQGTWSYTPTLAQGTYSVTATATSSAGGANTSGVSPTYGFTIDTQAPASPTAGYTDTGAADGVTSSPTLSGTTEAGSTVKVYAADGTTFLGNATVTGTSWTYTPSAGQLVQGANTFKVQATDGAGNASPLATVSYGYDTQAPAAPTAGYTDTGAADGVTSSPTLSGTTEAGSTVKVYAADGTTFLGNATVTGTSWTYTPSAGQLVQGANTFKVQATDGAGNASPLATVSYGYDTQAPAAPTAGYTDTGAADGVTSSPTLSGTTEAGSTVKVYAADGTTFLGNATVTGTSWTYTPSAGQLVQGANTFKVQATDGAGNASPLATVSYGYDTQADDDVAVTLVDASVLSGPGGGAEIKFAVANLDPGSAITITFTGTLGGAPVEKSLTYEEVQDALAGGGFLTADVSGLYGDVQASFEVIDGAANVYDGLAASLEDDPVCFYPGTRIATPSGEKTVEILKPGDLVLTASGVAVPVRWLGRQTVSTRFADPLRVLPVRIRAGALGENLPVRDLLVSPSHAVLLGDVLVQAGALVNGTSVIRERDVPTVYTYYHVEVAEHLLILAEGTPAETFVDTVDRERFDNFEEYLALGGSTPVVEMELPRAKSARQLPVTLRRELEARASSLIAPPAAAA